MRARSLERPRLTAMQPRHRQLVEQPRQPLVEHRDAVAGGLIAQCAGNPAFPDPGRAADQNVAVLADPQPAGQPLHG